MIQGDRFDIVGSYRTVFQTGLVTTIAAATASAGWLGSLRFATAAPYALRIRRLEAEFLLTTAFGAAQEVGFDASIARNFSASPTGGTAVTVAADAGKRRTAHVANPFSAAGDVRGASTTAIVAGTQTLDGTPIARGSYWAGAIGAKYGREVFEFTAADLAPILVANEGLVFRNTVLMGATGVGRWTFGVDYDLIALLTNP